MAPPDARQDGTSASPNLRRSVDLPTATRPPTTGQSESDAANKEFGRSSSPSTPDDEDAAADDGDEGIANAMERSKSSVSIAATLPWYRELLFVTVVCLAQLFTQAGLGQALAILHIIGDQWGITNPGQLSWFIAGYSLTVGTFILFSGRLGDLFGYKKMFLIGMTWFSLWSMVCGLAVYSNHVLFVFARVLQGIGPSIVLPNGLALLGASYQPGLKKSLAFAAFGATAPTGSILGAVFSSLFALVWWPWAFWCFAIVLAVVVAIAAYAVPVVEPSRKEGLPDTLSAKIALLDLPGAITGVTGLVLINFAWNQAPIVGWDMPYVYVTLILGALFVAVFFVIEIRYSPEPLIPFDALSFDVSFVLGAIACGWSCFGIWLWYTWQFFEESRGASPLLATAWFCPVTVSGAVAAAVVGFMLHKIGPPLVMTGSLVCFTVGTILMATAPVDQTYWAQSFVSTLVTPWGMDMSFPAATLILSNAVARRHQGIAASLVSTVVNYSIALGLGFAGTAEVYTNNGGTTPAEKLRGYRSGYYTGIGLAGLGIFVCLAYVFKHRQIGKRAAPDEETAATPGTDEDRAGRSGDEEKVEL